MLYCFVVWLWGLHGGYSANVSKMVVFWGLPMVQNLLAEVKVADDRASICERKDSTGNVKCKIKNIKYGDSEVIISVIDGRRRGNKTIKFHRRAESYTFVTVKRHALLVIAICIVVNQGTHCTLIETATA